MGSLHASLSCRVTDRDFLLGSVWEGTGEELHTNRHVARDSMFGARVLSGVSGMLLAVNTWDPRLLVGAPTEVEWSFSSPLFEGSELLVDVDAGDEGLDVVGRVGAERAATGRLGFGAPGALAMIEGRATRGRTMTAADIELFRTWLGPHDDTPEEVVPWPLVVLTASGLVNRTDYLGPHQFVLNRWFRWSFAALPVVEDTIHCVIGPVAARRSARRPDLQVAEFAVSVLSSPTGRALANVEWVVIFREQ